MKYSPTCNLYLELTVVCTCIVITEQAEVMQIQLTLWQCLLAARSTVSFKTQKSRPIQERLVCFLSVSSY